MIETDYGADHDGDSDPEYACLFWPGHETTICDRFGRPPFVGTLHRQGWESVWEFLGSVPVCEGCLVGWTMATRPPAERLPEAVEVAMAKGNHGVAFGTEWTPEHIEAIWRHGATVGMAVKDMAATLDRVAGRGLGPAVEDFADALQDIGTAMTSRAKVECSDGETRIVVPAHLEPADVDEENGTVNWPPSGCPEKPCPRCDV